MSRFLGVFAYPSHPLAEGGTLKFHSGCALKYPGCGLALSTFAGTMGFPGS